jgi:putative endonuclease
VDAGQRGRRGEEIAARFLADKGLTVLDRNWRGGAGEIDIVARDGESMVFVEVKTHRDPSYLEWSVGPDKRRRIVSASRRWLALHPRCDEKFVRYDVVLVGDGSVEHIQDAFGE